MLPFPGGGSDFPFFINLLLLSSTRRYLNWVKRNRGFQNTIGSLLNNLESELQNHPDFPEIYDDDIRAIDVFRKAGDLGQFVVTDDELTDKEESVGSPNEESRSVASSHRRSSIGSNVSSIRSQMSSTQKSLSPVYEEGEPESGSDDDSQPADESPHKAGRSVASASAVSMITELKEDDSSEGSETMEA
jgi:hypothetical protein